METSSTYPKFSFLRFFYTLVLVPLLLVSPGLVGDVMGQDQARTYANFQGTFERGTGALGSPVLVGSVDNAGNAANGNPKNASTLSVPIGALNLVGTTQFLEFTTDGQHSNVRTIAANTPVTVKFSLPSEVLGLLSSVSIGTFTDLQHVDE